MSLGSQVEKYRKSAGCSYADIEAMSGVSTGNINALEKRNSKRSEHTQALARAFGLTTDELLDEEADHTERVIAHITNWRQTKTMPEWSTGVRENAQSWDVGYWPFRVTKDRAKAALTTQDIQQVDAYILALVQAREAEAGNTPPRQANERP